MTLRRRMRVLCAATLCSFLASSGGAEESLSGVYIYFQKTTSVTKMPVLADVVATTRAVSIQTLSEEGEWLKGTGTLCDVQIRSSSKLVKTILPAAFRTALPAVVTNARLTKQGGTIHFEQPPQTLVLGANLKNDESDALPTSPSDPRVRDDDKDGKPGVTVQIEGIVSGEIYLVQRSTSRLSGHATPGGFHGEIEFTNDQEILNATTSVLKRNPSAKPDPSRSGFILQKVDPKTTCTEARRIARSW